MTKELGKDLTRAGESGIYVREGRFDLAIVAGPRIENWPSIGVRTISSLCAESGLVVGLFGGEALTVRGVIPLPGTGGLVLVEDVQNRIHRIQARAVVKFGVDPELPDPFVGWRSPGLIPLSTAERLLRDPKVGWGKSTVILGTGNKALRFGSALLESGVQEVFCVESYVQWGAKRFAGWEVERRRFEMAGGKMLEAQPVSLSPKGALVWEFRLKDAQGVRVLEVARVVSAGPFRPSAGWREHPPGSFLFELNHTAGVTKPEDVEGWVLEEERARYLGCRITRRLVTDLGSRREEIDRLYKRARGRLKRYESHREKPFTPKYQGKWIGATDAKLIRQFSGVPQTAQLTRRVAAVECFEDIPCNLCENACPENALELGKVPRPQELILQESKCTGCGLCLSACPSGTPVLLMERENHPLAAITLAVRTSGYRWKAGDFATLLNRRGESLGNARVSEVGLEAKDPQWVTLEVPAHLAWEARSIRRTKNSAAEDPDYLASLARETSTKDTVEVTVNGEKRLLREKISIATALFETGQSRAEDVLYCPDGSCGLCSCVVDGGRQLACQTPVRRGMSIKLQADETPSTEEPLCPCLGITRSQVVSRMQQGKLGSPEAVLSVTHVGEGKCHGQLCMDSFKRVLMDQGLDVSQWIDWRFPWTEWVVPHS
jgi:ferredoxin